MVNEVGLEIVYFDHTYILWDIVRVQCPIWCQYICGTVYMVDVVTVNLPSGFNGLMVNESGIEIIYIDQGSSFYTYKDLSQK